ncbi:SgrR family transcriptional regulator [Vibrio scophthalmi]|uniref:SgrR family transcriptional regulator n=1 Tax=Vibrio scophthalmi TaxID=45658 RepID=UPI002FF3B678
MSNINLLRYYSRLAPLGISATIKIALPTVAERLCTTPRHARNLLGQMQALNWLSWAPKAGRNQRSSLTLHYALFDLKSQLAASRISQGQYEKALQILDDDQIEFGRLLQHTSGATLREGRLHIQLTYKRAFERLVPHQLQRSSERYLIRQLYCCLVGCTNDGVLTPQLAHHWHYDEDALTWTFYLRPGLTFHNGAPIDANSVVALFEQLRKLGHYRSELSHLKSVHSPGHNKVMFELSLPDQGFGGLLSGVKYSIQPPSQVHDTKQSQVVGSGPFEVSEHSSAKLDLQAFERFYACRALTDQVTIWQIEEPTAHKKQIETNQPGAQDPCHHYLSHAVSHEPQTDIKRSRVEDGCMFVLFNQTACNTLNDAQRRFLSTFITPLRVLKQLQESGRAFGCEVAQNLLPMWHKVIRPTMPRVPLPNHISIAVYDYTALQSCALAIQSLLETLGVEVTVHSYSYRELTALAESGQLQASLIVTNINLDDNRHASAFNSLYHNPIVQACIGEDSKRWLLSTLDDLRSTTPLANYLEALEPIASALINQFWLSPLFHHRQTLRFEGVLKDVELTNWGWPDIKNVWSID